MPPSIRHFTLAGLLLAASALGQDNQAQMVVLDDLNSMEIQIGAAGGGVVGPGEVMFYAGYDSERGTEVAIQTPYSSGSRVDQWPGLQSGNPTQFTVMGEYVIWVANDGIHGPEIRGSQTTAPGSPVVVLPPGNPLIDLQPGASHAPPTILGSGDGWAWFTVAERNNQGRLVTKLWAMNGFHTLVPVAEFELNSIIQASAVADRAFLLFVARQPGSPVHQLYRVTTGNCVTVDNLDPAGTGAVPDAPVYAATSSFACFRRISGDYALRVVNLSSGAVSTLPAQSSSALPAWFATNGTDRVCYAGTTAAAGAELWTTWREGNGPVQTALLADVYAGSADSMPSRLAMSPGNPTVFFQVKEGPGRDLWFVDPLEKPTVVPHKLKSAVHTSPQQVMLGEKEIALVMPGVHTDVISIHGHGLQPVDVDVPKIVKIWNPSTSTPQYKDLCVHCRDGSGSESLFRLSPMAEQWDPYYPLLELFSGPLQLADFFGSAPYFTVRTGADGLKILARANWMNIEPVNPIYGLSNLRPSSMPADFTELDDALLFTAGVGQYRSLYASMDGQEHSVAQVQSVYRPEQLAAFQGRVFMLGHHSDNGTGLKRIYEAKKMGSSITASSYDNAPHLATALKVAGTKLYFSEPHGADEELLQVMLPDRTLAHSITFYRDASGTGITQMTAAGTRLFFVAPADDTTNAPHVMWSTDGTEAGTFTPSLPPALGSPRILGAAGNACVFQTLSPNGENFRLHFWDGTAAGPVPYVEGAAQDAPEPNSVAGQPGGVYMGGRFYFTTPAGDVMSVNENHVEVVYHSGDRVVRPDTLAVLGGRLLFLSVDGASAGALHSFTESGGVETLASFDRGLRACPLHVLNGQAYFTAIEFDSPSRSSLWQTDGTQAGTLRARQGLTQRAVSRLAMGTYRNHLVLAGEDMGRTTGLEPALLNHPPVIPVPPVLTGFQRGQPVAFTYAQIVAGQPTDADGDTTAPLWLEAMEGTLQRNGSPVETASTPIEPGDTFVWMPPASLSGVVEGLRLTTSDSWSQSHAPVQTRIDSPLDTWTRGHFTDVELEDPMVSAPDADADGDGVANALEFVFGRHPRTHNAEPPCTPSMADAPGGGGRVVRFSFVRAAALTEGTVLTVESSLDLMAQPWPAVATKTHNGPWTGAATVTETPLPDGRVQVVVETPEDAGGQAFMRLSVTL